MIEDRVKDGRHLMAREPAIGWPGRAACPTCVEGLLDYKVWLDRWRCESCGREYFGDYYRIEIAPVLVKRLL